MMESIGDIIAQAVSSSRLATQCTIQMAGVTFAFGATRVLMTDDKRFLETEETFFDEVLRAPISAFIREPATNDLVTVGGKPYAVLNVYPRTSVYLITLTARRVR